MTRIRAVGIVIKSGQLLVIKRNNHGQKYFTFPGGGVEAGESIEQAVLRELMEETQIKCEIDREIYYVKYDNGNEDRFFLCNYIGGKPNLTLDSEEMAENLLGNNTYKPQWLAVEKLPSTLIYNLEVRDRLIEDIKTGFSPEAKIIELNIDELRQTL